MTAGWPASSTRTPIKGWAGGPNVRPTVALCDPTLTTSMPPRVTADTDSTRCRRRSSRHAQFNPYADALLLPAVETIGRYLPKAFANGPDLEGALGDASAATMVGAASPSPA